MDISISRKESRVWDDEFDRQFFTEEEIKESNERVKKIVSQIEDSESE